MFSEQNPWVAEREATLCTWKFDYNRGYISNMSVSLINDFMCLSERQIKNYALMIKECGFTGIQVTDICAAWRASGSWENVHDKFRILSEACHDIGMHISIWCWAAEFSGHGWSEPEAVYVNADPSRPACEDPRVLEVFNRYYDIYADLAPCADRVIAHFFDPGNLPDMTSVIYFAKLLASKFRAVNPGIKVAVDTWGCPEGCLQALVDAGMDDVMLMELPFLPAWQEPGKRAAFREEVKKLGCGLGMWGWYTSDMEIDQLPILCVNNRVLKHVFNTTRQQADHVMVPDYWSEIDSYHILNFFSLYAAGHLLIDPDADPDALLMESAVAVAGCRDDAEILFRVLELVRDARSGDSWDSYWDTTPDYVLRNYDHENVLSRIDEAVSSLETLIGRPEPDEGIPFPITRRQLYRLMLPHLFQIKQYAQFCRDLAALEKLASAGAGDEVLQEGVDRLGCEIPEYNCVTGLWGQSEAREAFSRCASFCVSHGLRAPERSPTARYKFKHRIVDHLMVNQRGRNEIVRVSTDFYESNYLGEELTRSLMDELTEEGVLEKGADGLYSLADWQDYRFDFSW